MRTLFLEAPFEGEVRLTQDSLNYLKEKNIKAVGLYASVQFVSQLDQVKQQLQEANIQIITSKADRTHVQSQLLGCDNYHNSLNLNEQQQGQIDCYLYIGDGRFHPLALVYGQKDLPNTQVKEVVCNDPIQNKMYFMGFDIIKNILIKYRSSLMKFLSSDVIGVISTIKPGQEQFKPSLALEKKFPDKYFYYFIDNDVSFHQLENFPFIQTWVNTTCPRVGFDDQEKFKNGVINLNDAFLAKEILSKDSVLNNLKP